MSDFEKLINASDLIEWIIETDPDWCVGSVRSIIDHIDKMPSAQTETHEERTETHGVCLDTISRKAAIDALDKIFPADPMRNDYTQGITCGAALATEYIKQLSSAQQKWIPCSERLPEERQEILATTTDNAWGDVVIIRTYYKEMHKSVIAWMPLPEPYREGES